MAVNMYDERRRGRGGRVTTRRNVLAAPRDIRKPHTRQTARRPPRGRSSANRYERVQEAFDEEEFIKVSSESVVKTVAGKIAHATRRGDPPAVLAIGANSLNQAVKAVATAREFLKEEDTDLSCQPAFRDRRQEASLALYLAKRPITAYPIHHLAELTVGSNSAVEQVAGALAARVRENKNVCLSAIGVDAVAVAIRAVCQARLYLEDDHVDIKALPEKVQIDKGESTLNGIKLNIVVEEA